MAISVARRNLCAAAHSYSVFYIFGTNDFIAFFRTATFAVTLAAVAKMFVLAMAVQGPK